MARKPSPPVHAQQDLFHHSTPLAERLIRSLSRTLDLEKTIKELGITKKEAKDALCGIVADFFEKKPSAPSTSVGGAKGGADERVRGVSKAGAGKKRREAKAPARPSGEPAPGAGKGKEAGGVFRVYVDGGSRGNPGPSGAGAVIIDPLGRVVKRLKKHLGVGTNNRAEYMALIMGLEAARALGAERVHVYADSELVVRQVTGRYRVKSPALEPLYKKVKGLLSAFISFRISHVPRSANSEADGLANEAMDRSARR